MASIGDFFGKGSIGEQLLIWGVLNQIIGVLIQPGAREVSQLVNETFPNDILSPEALASAVVRNFRSPSDAASQAAKSGIGGGDFQTLVHLAGDAPAPGELAIALRRQLIPEGGTGPDAISFAQGIAEGRLGDKWADTIKALSLIWPTPADALQALLVGYLPEGEAKALFTKLGGDPQYFDMLYFNHGTAPTPTQLLEMWNRGVIPEDSGSPTAPGYVQGFLQGPWRNEWLTPFKELRVYYPPPRTITALHREGAISDEQAATLLAKQGMQPDMITAYLHSGKSGAVAKAKELTEADVIKLYESHVLDKANTEKLLQALNYSADNAAYLIELADLRVAVAGVNAAISRTRTLYTTRKITESAARAELAALQVPGDQISIIITDWNLLRGINVKQLTEPQIVSAWDYGVLTEAEALSELESIGYTALDAWILLSIKNKAPLKSARPGVTPTPGVLP